MELPNIFIHGIDYNVLKFLPAEKVLNMCSFNKQFAVICNDENFWRSKTEYDYSGAVNLKPENLTWKQLYVSLAQKTLKYFPVYYNITKQIQNDPQQTIFPDENLLGYVWIKNTNTMGEAYKSISDLCISKGISDKYFVHVLLDETYHPEYTPILLNATNSITENRVEYYGSLWENLIGFDIILGEANIQWPRAYDEEGTIYIKLPDRPLMRFRYNV